MMDPQLCSLALTFVIFGSWIEQGDVEDFELFCPETWKENEVIVLTCTVLKANVLLFCPDQASHNLYFRVRPLRSLSTRRAMHACFVYQWKDCHVRNLTTSQGCSCVGDTGIYFIYQYRFNVSSASNGTWDCNIRCYYDTVLSGSTWDFKGHNCVNKSIVKESIGVCPDNVHHCAQTCKLVEGSFVCGCFPGYTLNSDGFSCKETAGKVIKPTGTNLSPGRKFLGFPLYCSIITLLLVII